MIRRLARASFRSTIGSGSRRPLPRSGRTRERATSSRSTSSDRSSSLRDDGSPSPRRSRTPSGSCTRARPVVTRTAAPLPILRPDQRGRRNPAEYRRPSRGVSTSLRILIVFLLVLGNAIFVAAGYALVTRRRSRLEERAERGGRGARTALRLMDDPVRFISTVQVGITISAILLGAIGEPLLSGLIEPPLSTTVSFLIAFAILTYLSVVLGELVPKAVALQRAEMLAVALAVPLDLLAKIAHPLVWVLQVAANVVLRLFRIKPAPAGVIAHTPAE